jgi:hypothetical protein
MDLKPSVHAGAGAGLKSFYVGNVRLGGAEAGSEPQEMRVFFDTGSGQVILDSTRCPSQPCLHHRRYSPVKSHAVDVYVDGTPAKAGEHGDRATIGLDSNDAAPGQVQGDFVRDRVCLGMERSQGSREEACTELTIVAATNLTAEPFDEAPFDGIVGLGLGSLSINEEFSFFGRLAEKTGLSPQFALFVPGAGQSDGAEITFGGYNSARLASSLVWAPVKNSEEGFWQIGIKSLRVGDQDLDLCAGRGCRGLIDSSSSRLGVPDEVLPKLEAALGGGGSALCATGPELRFELEETGALLALGPRDYGEPLDGGCTPQLHPLRREDRSKAGLIEQGGVKLHDIGGLTDLTFILGEPFLRKYYTVFDWEEKRLGFGVAAGRAPEGQQEFILMQCKTEVGRKAFHDDEDDEAELPF